jgi:hypothetical protein
METRKRRFLFMRNAELTLPLITEVNPVTFMKTGLKHYSCVAIFLVGYYLGMRNAELTLTLQLLNE